MVTSAPSHVKVVIGLFLFPLPVRSLKRRFGVETPLASSIEAPGFRDPRRRFGKIAVARNDAEAIESAAEGCAFSASINTAGFSTLPWVMFFVECSDSRRAKPGGFDIRRFTLNF
jgi:hypothetical protein